MRLFAIATVSLFAAFAVASALAAPDCSSKTILQPLPLRATMLPPLSVELQGNPHALGTPDGVLAYAGGEAQSVDRVLARLHTEACRPTATTAAYVPKTKWDNTPYRYNAGGNGKKFTADDFDAWMKANGIHVSKGAPQPAPSADPGLSAQPVK